MAAFAFILDASRALSRSMVTTWVIAERIVAEWIALVSDALFTGGADDDECWVMRSRVCCLTGCAFPGRVPARRHVREWLYRGGAQPGGSAGRADHQQGSNAGIKDR